MIEHPLSLSFSVFNSCAGYNNLRIIQLHSKSSSFIFWSANNKWDLSMHTPMLVIKMEKYGILQCHMKTTCHSCSKLLPVTVMSTTTKKILFSPQTCSFGSQIIKIAHNIWFSNTFALNFSVSLTPSSYKMMTVCRKQCVSQNWSQQDYSVLHKERKWIPKVA